MDSNNAPLLIFICFFAGIISTSIVAYIFASVFGMKKLLWYQSKQMEVLKAMARKAGVTDNELYDIEMKKEHHQ